MLYHDEVKTSYALESDLGENENVTRCFEMMLRDVRENGVAIEKPSRTERDFFPAYVRRTNAEGVAYETTLLVTDLVYERTPMFCSDLLSLTARVGMGIAEDFRRVFCHFQTPSVVRQRCAISESDS